MSKVTQSLEVNSSPDSVMAYIIDITNHPAFIVRSNPSPTSRAT